MGVTTTKSLDGPGGIFVSADSYVDLAAWHRTADELRANDPVHRVEIDGFVPFYALYYVFTRWVDVQPFGLCLLGGLGTEIAAGALLFAGFVLAATNTPPSQFNSPVVQAQPPSGQFRQPMQPQNPAVPNFPQPEFPQPNIPQPRPQPNFPQPSLSTGSRSENDYPI